MPKHVLRALSQLLSEVPVLKTAVEKVKPRLESLGVNFYVGLNEQSRGGYDAETPFEYVEEYFGDDSFDAKKNVMIIIYMTRGYKKRDKSRCIMINYEGLSPDDAKIVAKIFKEFVSNHFAWDGNLKSRMLLSQTNASDCEDI